MCARVFKKNMEIPVEIRRIESHLGRFEPLFDCTKDKKKINRALITAANNGDLKKVKQLIGEGAERGHRNKVRLRAIDYARTNDYLRVVEFLEEKPNNDLFLAIKKNNFDLFYKAMDEGANPNAKAGNGMTALITAIGFRRYKMAGHLADNGADVNEMSRTGHNPLMIAVIVEDLRLIKSLVEKGGKPELENWQGVSAKSLAESEGLFSVVKYFDGLKAEKTL